MRILIIGGTRFLGRTCAEETLRRGHRLTLFHRGQTQPDLFPEAERIFGDREANLESLRGRSWDAVIDPSGYFPRQVSGLLDAIAADTGHYTFISSISVYCDTRQPGIDESYPTGVLSDPDTDEITVTSYGPLKAQCEAAALDRMPARALIIRPGLIVGPHDPTDRFTYWPVRVAAGGDFLAPGRPDRWIQFIDVRDLAEWTLDLVESGTTGVFNATGTPGILTMEALLLACVQVSNRRSSPTWASDEFLLQEGVEPWAEMPLWIPDNDPDAPGFFQVSVKKAAEAGLAFRPVEATIQATLEWAQTRPEDHAWRAGLARQREFELLQKLRSPE